MSVEQTVSGGDDATILHGRVVADGFDDYRFSVRTVAFDHIRVEVFRSTSHRFVRDAGDIAASPERIVAVFVVGEGRCDGTVGGQRIEAGPGDVVVYDSDSEMDVVLTGPVRILRYMVAARHLPDYVLAGPPLPVGGVPRTALVNSTIAFLSALMADSGERSSQLVQAVSDLTLNLLAEVRGVLAHEPGSTGLRMRVESHVMDHLSDPQLTPGSIAVALGISLRSVHHAFEGEDTTVARLIRDRRLDAVANELRDRRGSVPMSDLAERHGFGSRDQLARSFRQRYGSTMKEYRELARAGA